MPPQNYPQPEDAPESGSSFDFRNLYYTLIEKIWVILLCVAAAAFLTWGYIKRAPRIYSATVVLQVAQEKKDILNAVDLQTEDLRSPEILKTIEKILQSRALFERVLLTNNLSDDPRFTEQSADNRPSKEQLVSRLEGMVTVNLQGGTRLINVRVENTDRALTEQIANSLVSEFMLQNYEQDSSSSHSGTQYLKEQEQILKKDLQAAENARQAYRATNDVSVALGEDQNIAIQKLKDIAQNLSQTENRRLNLESEIDQVKKKEGDLQGLLEIKSLATDPTVAEMKVKLADHEVKFEVLKKRYGPKHYAYIRDLDQLVGLKNALSNATVKAFQTLLSSYEAAKSNERELIKSWKAQEVVVNDVNKQQIRYNELSREVDSIRDQYQKVTQRLKETIVSEGWEQNKVRIIQPAYVPDSPVKPNKNRILLMGLMVGLMCGVGLALALEALDSSLKTPEQAETFLNIPLLTAIPQIATVQAGRKQLIMSEGGESFGAEAFRTLRTTLAMLGPEGTRRTFLFTSALPEEGKTFCALNYAWSLAQQGLRTVLIEGDLRCPAVQTALGGAGGTSPGVADYLIDQTSFGAIVQPTELANFSFIPAGTRIPNPSELLAQDGFGTLIEEALLHFDRVVVDSAPIQPVSDALLIVNRVQTVCFVVRANRTPRKAIQRARQILQNAGAPLAGFIFNGWTMTRGQHYYDYSYYPQYGQNTVAKT